MQAAEPQRLKLMIVDDHSEWRGFLSTMLGENRSVFECENGEAAISAFETVRPDWVLMDIAMSPMDGLTAASIIKQRHPEARIVFVTQHADRELREQAKRAGAAAFVAKDEIWQLFEIISSANPSD